MGDLKITDQKSLKSIKSILASGTDLCKLGPKGKLYCRHYYIDVQNLMLKYRGSKKKFDVSNRSFWTFVILKLYVKGGKLMLLKSQEKDQLTRIYFFMLLWNIMKLYTSWHTVWKWLKDQFRKADVNGNGSLNFAECTSLLKQLNICMDKKHVKALFD
ncbi:uncharacterized protein LOC106476611, partial [Limulus polyphemus]|uniref:Uncharacterized protein LOC106476611 n=1 Tax=Limulus polyphemus TaxID=6850 RepID=A0ABM1C1R4_LIMPO